MNFVIPRSSTTDLISTFRQLEYNKSNYGIIDVQLSLTTLEEVFLTVAESAELKVRIFLRIFFTFEKYKKNQTI